MGHSSDSDSSSSSSNHGRCHARRQRRRERRHDRRHHGGLISGLVGGQQHQDHGSGLISGLIGGLLGGQQRGPHPGDPRYGGGRQYAPPPMPPPGHPQRRDGYGDHPPNQLSDQRRGYASEHSPGRGDGYHGLPPVNQRDLGNASGSNHPIHPPPAYSSSKTPPPSSGHRIALDTNSPSFPGQPEAGIPPCYELDGTPVYLGSALFERSVFPCKIEVRQRSPAKPFVSYCGDEHPHRGRYDVLPYDPVRMEFVLTSHGRIPRGKRPIDGGHEESGHRLYHAVAIVDGLRLPGKTGEHLRCCYVGRNGIEHAVTENYEILCWREL